VGRVPREVSRGGKHRLGHISKQGNSWPRFLLVEAAQAAARIHPEGRRRYIRLAMRRHQSLFQGSDGAKTRRSLVRDVAKRL
jgi:transposase